MIKSAAAAASPAPEKIVKSNWIILFYGVLYIGISEPEISVAIHPFTIRTDPQTSNFKKYTSICPLGGQIYVYILNSLQKS